MRCRTLAVEKTVFSLILFAVLLSPPLQAKEITLGPITFNSDSLTSVSNSTSPLAATARCKDEGEKSCCVDPDSDEELRPQVAETYAIRKRKQEQRRKYPLCTPADNARPFVNFRYSQYPSTEIGKLKVTDLARLLLLEVGDTCSPRLGDPKDRAGEDSNSRRAPLCYYRSLLVNLSTSDKPNWIEGFRVTKDGLRVSAELFPHDKDPLPFTFAVNGTPITKEMRGLVFGSRDISTYHVEVYQDVAGCRKYALQYTQQRPEAIDIEIPILKLPEGSDNGIHVGAPKVYDSYLLRSKMNTAAQQLGTISPWNAAAITNAYGTLQGITRDVSYFAAQVQTAATPSQVVTNTTGSTSLSPNITTSQSAQCPAGYFASQIGSTGVTCTQLPQPSSQCPNGYYVSQVTSSGPICSQLPNINSGSQLPPANFSSTQANAAPQSSQIVTTSPSLSPTIPATPTYSPIAPPTNVGISSVDMLAEQVQLNAQLQVYQMLLQGSQSDQFLLKNSRAVGTRAQTTIGFQISLAPPRQFKHAAAEVRVVIVPHPTADRYGVLGGDRVSVVNLLPSQKTYNVAKITSHQNAFGAGAVIEQVNVGLTTGRSKDRLYLAKDSDTVALQFPILPVPALEPPFPERVLETMEELIKEQGLGECEDTWEGDRRWLQRESIMFGWQFRPVLGAEYVAPGPREVFAQLALPSELNEEGWGPAVYIQTRWREYDEKRHVVGPIYRSSCNWTRVQDAVSILNPLRVHDVRWDDAGNAILKVQARGNFFASGMTVMLGGTNIPPTTFDGKTIQFFAPARDLLQDGDVQLLGENGQRTPLTVMSKTDQCRISTASLKAVPYPDGNSRVELRLEYESNYKNDGGIRPLLLIGNDVYGLQQRPYLDSEDANSCKPDNPDDPLSTVKCSYHFVAPTDSLRSAQTFVVRDPAWTQFSGRSAISFAPAFTGLTPLSVAAQRPGSEDKGSPPTHTAASTSAPIWYGVTGTSFHVFSGNGPYGVSAFIDDSSGLPLTSSNFRVLSDTAAEIQLPGSPKGKTLKIQWEPKTAGYTVFDGLPITWDLAIPASKEVQITSDPPFLYSGDSRVVTFQGQFADVVDVEFEGTVLLKPESSNPKKLEVPVSLAVTKTAGHKELVVKTLDKNGKPGKMVLPLDVFRR